MTDLDITGTNSTPEIITDYRQGNLFISGSVFPDDIFTVFHPLYNWLDNYLQEPAAKTTLFLHVTYLSPPAYNMIIDLVNKLNKAYQNGIALKVVWLYDPGDEEMEENGDDIGDLAKFPFVLKPLRKGLNEALN